jgi:hypothetical protein
MRLRIFMAGIGLPGMHKLVLVMAMVIAAFPSWAASAVVRDGNTVQLGDVTYRLDGIDAPELDQSCSGSGRFVASIRVRTRATEKDVAGLAPSRVKPRA